jgi:hypothetical protein
LGHDCRFDRRRAPWQDDPVRRFVLLSLLGIAILLAGSLAIVLWMTEAGPDLPAPEPAPVAAPAPPPERRPAVVVPPPPQVTASDIENFEKPVPRSVPEPPEGPAPVDMAAEERSLEALVSGKCGRMHVRLGEEMRKAGQEIAGHAVLLLDAEVQDGKVKLGQSRQQSPGNLRPSLVACAQMALRGQVFEVPGSTEGQHFTLQVVLGMAE